MTKHSYVVVFLKKLAWQVRESAWHGEQNMDNHIDWLIYQAIYLFIYLDKGWPITPKKSPLYSKIGEKIMHGRPRTNTRQKKKLRKFGH